MSDFYYVASPYTKYPTGRDDAVRIICFQAALLIKAGVPIFCPISHGHYLSVYGGIPDGDHTLWKAINKPFEERACGMIVVKMKGWDDSIGIADEIREFTETSRPIYYMVPGIVPPELIEAICG